MASNITSNILAIASLLSSTVLAGTGIYLTDRYNQQSYQHAVLEERNADRQVCLDNQAQALQLRTSIGNYETADPILKTAITDLYAGSAKACVDAGMSTQNISKLFNDQLKSDKNPQVAAYAASAEKAVTRQLTAARTIKKKEPPTSYFGIQTTDSDTNLDDKPLRLFDVEAPVVAPVGDQIIFQSRPDLTFQLDPAQTKTAIQKSGLISNLNQKISIYELSASTEDLGLTIGIDNLKYKGIGIRIVKATTSRVSPQNAEVLLCSSDTGCAVALLVAKQISASGRDVLVYRTTMYFNDRVYLVPGYGRGVIMPRQVPPY